MKLKYYLRGLGIGIAVTSLIMGISLGGKETLSDAEIKERAAQLGMVEESKVLFLGEDKLTTSALDAKEAVISENKTVSESKPSVSKNETLSENSKIETKKTTDIKNEISLSDNEVAASIPKENIIIQVASGQSSYGVCEELEKQGIIEDAKAFDSFLCAKGYDRKLVIGKHTIQAGMTLDEIGLALTK